MSKKILESARIIFIVSVFTLITVSEFDAIYLSLLEGSFDVKRFVRVSNIIEPIRNLFILLLVSVILSRVVREKALKRAEGIINKNRRGLAALFVLLFFAVSLYVAYFILDAMPHTGDGACYLFQGRIFREGRLSWPVPPYRFLVDCGVDVQIPEPDGRFVTLTLDTDGRWYTRSPLGYPFFLMLGLLIRSPWIVNPIAGTLFFIVLYFIGKEVYNEKTSLIALMLGVFSPFIILMSSEFFSHAVTLLFLSLFTLFLIKAIKNGGLLYPSISGAALGVAFDTRPFTAVGASFFLVLYFIYVSIKDRELKPLFSFTTALMFFVLVFFSYYGVQTGWRHLTAESQLFNIYGGGFGFKGDYHDMERVHTPFKALTIVNVTHQELNMFMFLWPIPALFFVLVSFIAGRVDRWDMLFLASHISLVATYFTWYSTGTGPGYGPRFQYESVLPLLLLSARGINALPGLLSSIPCINPRKTAVAFVILLFLINIVYLPTFLAKYKNHRGYGKYLKEGIEKEIQKIGIEKAVIISPSPYWFTTQWNTLNQEKQRVVYVVDQDNYHGKNATDYLVKYFFPQRECYRLDATKPDDIQLIGCVV